MENRITIIGLGCVGNSIGLALRRRVPTVEVIGHDVDPGRARRAAQMGAVTKTHWNLPASCAGTGLVILALPLPAARDTLEVLGPHLDEGCVVTDTTAPKVPMLEWAQQHLPEHVRFITGVPIPGPATPAEDMLQGPQAARADLFKGGLYCLMPTRATDEAAVTTLTGLAGVLGASPLFMEPLEYDGLWAGAADLPALIAAAYLQATVDSPGWKDMRKVAGADMATLTGPAAADPVALHESAMLNRENLLRRLDMFIEELNRVRQQLLENDGHALKETYTHAAEARAHWLNERSKGTWEEIPQTENLPGIGEHLLRALFGGLVDRRTTRKGKRPSKKEDRG